jgi:thiol-disulfide isomerase/thioredoxin
MSTRQRIFVSLLFAYFVGSAQTVSHVYKINELLRRIDTTKTPMVINFWATWCKPCVEELPAFDSLYHSDSKCTVLLVSLDFVEDLDKKVNIFLQKNKISAECVLLDEVNGNNFIDKISRDWSGAIPATLIKSNGRRHLINKKVQFSELEKIIKN